MKMLARLALLWLAAPAPATKTDRSLGPKWGALVTRFPIFIIPPSVRPQLVLVLTAALLLAACLISVALAHRAFLDGCVCIVNSIARAAVCLTATVALGALAEVFSAKLSLRAAAILLYVQTIVFLTALFFLVQHVFFLLEIV